MNMRYNTLRVVWAALLTLQAAGGWAVPAKPGMHAYTMPDGTTVDVAIVGDENQHYYMTSDEYVLLPDSEGALRYATVGVDGLLKLGTVKATDVQERTSEEKTMLQSIDRELVRAVADRAILARRAKTAPRRIPDGMITDYPTTGTPKGLVVLVEFQDVKFKTNNPEQAFYDMLNKPGYNLNGATGSAFDYYRDNSNGTFRPEFEVYGPLTLPEPEPYYGGQSGALYDNQGWLMARDGAIALREAYPELDFSEFDNDGDGFVDNIFFFYAGYGQNEGAPAWTIWPHAAELWDMYNIDLTYDGVKVNKYACSNELCGTSGTTLTGIGTFVHEFSHILGLMDIYPKLSSNRDVSPGSWNVMDHGSYNNGGHTPPNLNAFERYCLGWLKPRRLGGPENVILKPLHASNDAVLIATESDLEFFLLENRQQSGWDAFVGGHGMLVWHIDYDREIWNSNHINNEYNHQRVDLVEADNTIGETSRSGDPFPGAGNVKNFTSSTVPAMKTWINVDPDMPLTDIAEVDGNITFRVKGGGDALEVPEALPATGVTPVSFTANWEMVAGIGVYELDVCLGETQVPFLSQRVSGSTSFEVDGLEPETAYSYTVRSFDGERFSYDSERISLTTLPPTLDMLAPVSLEATEVAANGFTARWEAMEEADGYKINVYGKRIIDPEVETVDFTGGIVMPDGWSTNCSTTGSLNGYVGNAAPALRMMYDNDRLVTAVYEGGVNSLSFWYRGNSTDEAASITVESNQGGVWQPIHTVMPVSRAEGVVVTLGKEAADAAIPAGATQLRIVFHRGEKGSLYIDDIVLEHDASFEPLPVDGFANLDCGNELSARVTGLECNTYYYYTLTGYNSAGLQSRSSNETCVYTLDNTSVGSVDKTGAPLFEAVNGGVVIVADKPEHIMLTRLDGIILHCGVVSPGKTYVPLNEGLYVLSIGGRNYKTVVGK